MATANWAAQVTTTRASVDQVAGKYPQRQFRLGRCALTACDGPWDGEDYGDVERFVRIWRGSASDGARMEADLIRYAKKRHATRCRNTQAGDTATDPDESQVIFLAIWPKKA